MRLVAKTDADKVPATVKQGEKVDVKTYYVEKAKGNVLPKHFLSEENKDKTNIVINGENVSVMRNVARSEYCGFQLGDQCYYVRDHSFVENPEYVTFAKPAKEAAPKKEKPAKPAKEEPATVQAKKRYKVTSVKEGNMEVEMTGKQLIEKLGLDKANKALQGKTPKNFLVEEITGEATEETVTEETTETAIDASADFGA